MGDPYVVLGYAVTYGSIFLYGTALLVRLRRRTALVREITAPDSQPGADSLGPPAGPTGARND